jgi:WD40 repeat protein
LLLPDGRALSWGWDDTLRIWDLATGANRMLGGHEDYVYGALLLPDGRALSWSSDRTLRIWTLATGRSRVLVGHRDVVLGARLLPDGRAISWSADRSVRLWDLHGDAASVAFSFDTKPTVLVPHSNGVLVGDDFGRIHFLEVRPGTSEQT